MNQEQSVRFGSAVLIMAAVSFWFWAAWVVFAGSVPATSSVLGYDLPQSVSRLGDIACLPLAFLLTVGILTSQRLTEKSERDLVGIGEEGWGIAMTFFLIFSVVALMVSLGIASVVAFWSGRAAFWILVIICLVISQGWSELSGSRVFGLWAATALGAVLCLIYGLAYGFAIGLTLQTAFVVAHLAIDAAIHLPQIFRTHHRLGVS